MTLGLRCAAWILVSTSVACAARLDETHTGASSPASDGALVQMQQRMSALEGRVAQLEQSRSEPASERAPAPPTTGWSCSAKCGSQSTQTTEPRIVYERVTGQGTSAAAAYQDLVDHCSGTVYERFEDGRMVGGELKSVCLQDAGADAR